jgi:hypothetical protein
MRSGQAVFLTIPKVGCSFIGTLTKEISNNIVFQKYHKPVSDFSSNNLYFVSVRNPWDHYVSKWKWTQKTGSSVILNCMKGVADQGTLKQNFHLYLKTLLTADPIIFNQGNSDFHYKYVSSPLNYLGMYSYRNIYFIDITNVDLKYNLEQLEKYYIEKYLDSGILHPLRFTHLYEDFCNLVKENQEKFDLRVGWERTLESYEKYKNPRDVGNPNSFFKIHRPKEDDYREYYTDELAELVEKKEKFMIDLYNFKFDDYEKDNKNGKI